MSSDQPKAGIQYPIVLGDSFGTDYSTLRLDFVPASCDRIAQGELHIDPDNMATLSLPSTNNDTTVVFQGSFHPSKDDLDCVAVFDVDSQSFKLEVLSGGQATLKHMPGSKRDKNTASNKINSKEKPIANEKASVLPPAKVASAPKTRKPAANSPAVPAAVSQEEIADDFFHGALE